MTATGVSRSGARPIDLRSDTVTLPTPEMREVMARAEVGDDMYGEDPSVQALEARVAQLLGKDRSLFVPTGTMANQIALSLHTRHGDSVFVPWGAHCVGHESGAGPAFSGVTFIELGDAGWISPEDLGKKWHEPRYYEPRPSLLWLENTHNQSGGTPLSVERCVATAGASKARGLATHVDGARLWNAAQALGTTPRELADPFTTASVCFSKGLGAPVGSAIAVPRALYPQALRLRKMFGGAMRQSGILAAAALYALDHHVERLADDHRRAQLLATLIASLANVGVAGLVQTNIVVFRVAGRTADEVVRHCAERGLLVGRLDSETLRAVTHLGITDDDVQTAGQVLSQVSLSKSAGKADAI